MTVERSIVLDQRRVERIRSLDGDPSYTQIQVFREVCRGYNDALDVQLEEIRVAAEDLSDPRLVAEMSQFNESLQLFVVGWRDMTPEEHGEVEHRLAMESDPRTNDRKQFERLKVKHPEWFLES